jgi:DNA topoisomerase-1
VALRIICDRELEIEAFKSQEYWTIDGTFTTPQGQEFSASLQAIAGQKIGKLDIKDETSARAIEQTLRGRYRLTAFRANLPNLTLRAVRSTAEASRKLASRPTMQVAQRLYEGVDIDGIRWALSPVANRWC